MLKLALIAGIVGAGMFAAAAAGWWLLVRDDAQLATDPPEIPAELLEATATPSGAGAGQPVSGGTGDTSGATLAFDVNPELSEAAYFVDEELASVGLPSTAKGATNDVTGSFTLTADGTALAAGTTSQLTIGLTTLTSDESRRDQRVQEALETSVYPTATFTITSVAGYDPAIAEGEEQSLQLTGILDLHGVQKEVTSEVTAFREGNVISALATVTIAFADFDITAPTFAGLVSIDDEATLQVQLIAEAA